MRRMLSEQKARPHPATATSTSACNFHLKTGGGSNIVGPSHSSPAVSQTSLPIHLRPQMSNESILSDTSQESPVPLLNHSGQGSLDASAATTEDVSSFSHLADESSCMGTNETAEQIIELLDRLEKSGGVLNGTKDLMHCKTCTGQLQSL